MNHGDPDDASLRGIASLHPRLQGVGRETLREAASCFTPAPSQLRIMRFSSCNLTAIYSSHSDSLEYTRDPVSTEPTPIWIPCLAGASPGKQFRETEGTGPAVGGGVSSGRS